MQIFNRLLKLIGYLAVAAVAVFAGYVILMSSGIFYKPDSVVEFVDNPDQRDDAGPILIVGGTKGTGLEIVKELVATGEDVVVTVRATSNTTALESLGVDTVIMDALERDQVFAAANSRDYRAIISTLGTSTSDLPKRRNPLESLLYGPVLMDPNSRPDFIGNRNVTDAALAAGIKRMILITVIGAGDSATAVPIPARRSHNSVTPLKTQAEDYLRASGLDYTIIRPGGLGPRNLAYTGQAKLTEDAETYSYLGRRDLALLTIAALHDSQTIDKTYTAYDPERRWFWKLFID
jgi:uncharacterized protein YbjT (DUF2867 family)